MKNSVFAFSLVLIVSFILVVSFVFIERVNYRSAGSGFGSVTGFVVVTSSCPYTIMMSESQDTSVFGSSDRVYVYCLRDSDGDGYDGLNFELATSCPFSHQWCEGADVPDCNDRDSSIHPGAFESCNFLDDDCDGLVDEGFGSVNYSACSFFYKDVDGDKAIINQRYYSEKSGSNPNDYKQVGLDSSGSPDFVGSGVGTWDCNDRDSSIRPGAFESCNFLDDDCDGLVDEGSVCPSASDASVLPGNSSVKYYFDGSNRIRLATISNPDLRPVRIFRSLN